MPTFTLTVQSFTPPSLPSPPSLDRPSAPLTFTLALPSRGNDPLYPATYLQLSWTYAGDREVFASNIITARDLVKSGPEEGVYEVVVPGSDVPRMKLPEGLSAAVDVTAHAWQGEKFLGKWPLGSIEGLGLVGAATA